MKFTIAQIHALRPCNMAPGEKYSRENLKKLFGGNSIDALKFLDLEIPDEDRLWVIFRLDLLPDNAKRLLAADFAERVLPIYEKKYPGTTAVRDCIQGVRDFVAGKITRAQLDELRQVVVAADAAAYAAYAAAYAAASDAASDAAAYAASDAYAADAATAAASDAAYAADARRTHWKLISDKLCELLEAA